VILILLGFAEERLVPLNTDHLGACRFASSSDPAYMLISDALATTVKEILEERQFFPFPEGVELTLRSLGPRNDQGPDANTGRLFRRF
jgi:hypothetical protein